MGSFTNFCCRSGGSNLNAGSRIGSTTEPGLSADFTYASGNWVAGTGVFTVASGDPATDGVAVGDFASVYADGSTVTGFVGRVTARSSTTITVSLSSKIGTAPTDGTGNRTLKIGGAWQGPNGASAFPFTIASNTLLNASSQPARYNFKNDAQYNITATITHPVAYIGEISLEGYSSTYGDGGVAVIDGGTSGASYTLFTVSGSRWFRLANFHFKNNGATGTADGVVTTGVVTMVFENVTVSNVRGSGLNINNVRAYKCEAFECNQSNTSGKGGFDLGTSCTLSYCTAHHNTLSGIVIQNTAYPTISHCIISDQTYGISNSSNSWACTIFNSDFYNNTHGIYGTGGLYGPVLIVNSNFVKNITSDVFNAAGNPRLVKMINCGFGAGTMASTNGVDANVNAEQVGSVTYAANVTPWTDPANGDFRISLAAAKNAGVGSFSQRKSGWTGTIGYPDIGAAQATGGSSRPSLPFTQQVIG